MAFFTRFFNIYLRNLNNFHFFRKIYKEYSLCKETIIMTAINVFYFNVIHIFPNFINFNSLCLGPLPFFFVVKDLRHVIVAMIVTIYPLSICGKAHIPLPPSLTLDEMNFFLLEEKFFVVFYKFLQNLEEKAKATPLKFNDFNEKLNGFYKFFFFIKTVNWQKK